MDILLQHRGQISTQTREQIILTSNNWSRRNRRRERETEKVREREEREERKRERRMKDTRVMRIIILLWALIATFD